MKQFNRTDTFGDVVAKDVDPDTIEEEIKRRNRRLEKTLRGVVVTDVTRETFRTSVMLKVMTPDDVDETLVETAISTTTNDMHRRIHDEA